MLHFRYIHIILKISTIYIDAQIFCPFFVILVYVIFTYVHIRTIYVRSIVFN